MERFLSPLRAKLPDIDIDVESAAHRHLRAIFEPVRRERVTCVSMMDTYRVRHAVRDVGAALGYPDRRSTRSRRPFPTSGPQRPQRPGRAAELRASGLDVPRLQLMYDIVERLENGPPYIALHPCGCGALRHSGGCWI